VLGLGLVKVSLLFRPVRESGNGRRIALRATIPEFWKLGERECAMRQPGLCPGEGGGSESIARGRSPSLRCVTFNLLHGGLFSGLAGSAQALGHRLDLAAAELRRLNADVIGLQEASISRARGNVAARLAARLGYQAVYAPASCCLFLCERLNALLARLLNFTEGPALLSRFPIRSWAVEVLPRCGRLIEPRVLLYATVHTPWGLLPVATTHTSGESPQHHRVAEVLRHHRRALPTVLMGDFNALEDSAAMATFTHEAGFHDAFRRVLPAAGGFTSDQVLTESAPTVSQRIDYILLLPGAEVPGSICGSQVILNSPRRLPNGRVMWPSDHYGVLAEVGVCGAASARSSQRTATSRYSTRWFSSKIRRTEGKSVFSAP
jgi:endonuclease/exonuclease/phosphatase family metal-dependent hydrolase